MLARSNPQGRPTRSGAHPAHHEGHAPDEEEAQPVAHRHVFGQTNDLRRAGGTHQSRRQHPSGQPAGTGESVGPASRFAGDVKPLQAQVGGQLSDVVGPVEYRPLRTAIGETVPRALGSHDADPELLQE